MRFFTLTLLGLSACAAPVEVSPQQSRSARIGSDGFLALDLLATWNDQAIPCGEGTFTVEVSISTDGEYGHYADLPPQSWVVACDDGRTGDLALVVDNSGSESGYLSELKAAASEMIDGVLSRGGRASVVRVSTEAEVLTPLTGDPTEIDMAMDSMFITNGWTALWDGIRMGSQTLGGPDGPVPQNPAIVDFCFEDRPLGVVAFTDGQDNNSADEAPELDLAAYPGDGVDTTLEDLKALTVGVASTPIYSIGLGREVDGVSLTDLADSTGARYQAIDHQNQISGVFDVLQGYFDATHQVCVELPSEECGEMFVNVEWEWTPESGGEPAFGAVVESLNFPCATAAPDPEGRVVTMLLTMGDPGIPSDTASMLAQQSVEWVSPKLRPEVLVVLDEGNGGEDTGDVDLVQWLLTDVDTTAVDFMVEATGGLTATDVDGYDVVWYANPGHPINDDLTIQTLEDFVEDGGGLVLQGDDMTWSKAPNEDTVGLTHLDHVNNGTKACGNKIDNNNGGTYTVTIGSDDHAVIRDLHGVTFTYGNDIDKSTARAEGEIVLATAVPTADPTCASRPVIVGYAP